MKCRNEEIAKAGNKIIHIELKFRLAQFILGLKVVSVRKKRILSQTIIALNYRKLLVKRRIDAKLLLKIKN